MLPVAGLMLTSEIIGKEIIGETSKGYIWSLRWYK